ncbi:MAG TPA: FAD-binding oxidoreductase [Minicystis sp.]|nr:FAD-binding oxidoreductase [Minicystis sp.]
MDAIYADPALARHARKIERIAAALRAHPGDRPVSLRKKAVSHQVPKRGDLRHSDPKIDVGDLDEILSIDPVARTCVAEPGVTFESLVRRTLPFGLVPIVVPELKTITIGGAVAGCSLESMSYRHGGFHDTCFEYEVLTATGEVMRCTPDGDDALLFQMMHGSFGTLGVLTKLAFRLVPAQPFVHVAYASYGTFGAYRDAIRRRADAQDVDFMDGIIHAPDHYVLSLGRFVERAPYTNRYDWMKVYYRSTAERDEDYLETYDYFYRYDNGVTNPTPRSAVARLLFGKFIHSAELLRLAEKLHRFLPEDRPQVTLDTFIPISRAEEFLAWYEKQIGYYPLWCVPYRRVHDYEWVTDEFWRTLDDDMFLDLAIYGMKQPPGRNVYREIEDELPRVHGIKTLISYNYYSEDEFWQTWNRPNYLAVKARTDPRGVFRDVYSKTCRAARGIEDARRRAA